MKNKITKYISGMLLITMMFGIMAISPNKAEADTTKKVTSSKVSTTKKSTVVKKPVTKKVVKKATTKKKIAKKIVKKKSKLVLNSPLIDPSNPPSSPRRR